MKVNYKNNHFEIKKMIIFLDTGRRDEALTNQIWY